MVAIELDQELEALGPLFAAPWPSLPNTTIACLPKPVLCIGNSRIAFAASSKRFHRASSLVEDFNSRRRNYFFLRRQIDPACLGLLRFFLNHQPFACSEKPERRGKSPAELLTGQSHPHWLEMLSFTRVWRACVTAYYLGSVRNHLRLPVLRGDGIAMPVLP